MQATQATNAIRLHIRWMMRRDMPEVLDIEARSCPTPWVEEDFLRCLRQRNCIGMVGEVGDKVIAYMVYELHKRKLHVMKFAVRPDHQRKGVGGQLIDKLKSKLSAHRRTAITLDAGDDRLPAHLFLRSQSFRATGVNRAEDSYRFLYSIDSDERG